MKKISIAVLFLLLGAAGCTTSQQAGVSATQSAPKLPAGAVMGPGTYASSKYGFSLQYGSGWYVVESSPEIIGFCKVQGTFTCATSKGKISADVAITVDQNTSKQSVKNFLLFTQGVDVSHQAPGTGVATIVVNGNPAVQFSAKNSTSGPETFVAHGSYVLDIAGNGSAADVSTLMATLQFGQ